MSLVANLITFATRVGTEFKDIRTLLNGNAADLSLLSTTEKGNLVGAINELKAALDTLEGGGVVIDDGTPTTGTVWSSQKIRDELDDAVEAIFGGTPDVTLDTIAEIAAALTDADIVATLTTSIGNRVRFDAAQSLDGGEQAQARENIDAAAASHGHDAATTSLPGFMSAADKLKLDGVATSANNYSHPTGDGNRHVPTTDAGDTSKFLKSNAVEGAAPDWAAVSKSDVGLGNVDNTSDANKPISDATQTALDGKAATSHTHADVTAGGASGFMTGSDKTKLDGIDSGANNYVHPTTDGSRHVPTTDEGDTLKFLKSGATAGSSPDWAGVTKADVGLSAVDNTSDADKPVSSATATALAGKVSTTDVGDTEHDFVDDFETALV